MSAAVVIFLIFLIATVIGGLIYYYYYYNDSNNNNNNNNNIPITPDTILYGDKIQIQINPCPTNGSYNPPNCTATSYLGACGNYSIGGSDTPLIHCGEAVSIVTDPGFINSTNTVFTVSGGPVGTPVGMQYFTLMNYNGNYICYCSDDPKAVVYAASPTIQFKSLDPSLYNTNSNITPYTILKQNSSIYLNLPSKDNCTGTCVPVQYISLSGYTKYTKCSRNCIIATDPDTQFIVVKNSSSLPPSPPHPLALPPIPPNTPSIILDGTPVRIKNIATGAYIADCGRVVAGCKILSLSKTKWAPVYLNTHGATTGTPISNLNLIGTYDVFGIKMGTCIAGRSNQQIPVGFLDFNNYTYMSDCSDINLCNSGIIIFNTSTQTLSPSHILVDGFATKGIFSLSMNNISMTGDCIADLIIEKTDSSNKNQLWQFELVPF
jgi:hypothetical protein